MGSSQTKRQTSNKPKPVLRPDTGKQGSRRPSVSSNLSQTQYQYENKNETTKKVINVYLKEKEKPIIKKYGSATSLQEKDELQYQLEKQFDYHDKDHDGYLNKLEIEKVFEGILYLVKADKRNPKAVELANNLKNLEMDSYDKISKDEFLRFLVMSVKE